MSRCPKCQHDLSIENLQSSQCPACGYRWEGNIPRRSVRAGKLRGMPKDPAGTAPGESDVPGDLEGLPQAITGVGVQGESSTNDPETWNEDHNALTYVADLSPEDIVRMSQIWRTVDDAVPSGMTIKSLEADEMDEAGPTVDVEQLLRELGAEEDSDETSIPPTGRPEEGRVSSIEATFVSDDFSSDSDAETPPEFPESSDSAEASEEADGSKTGSGETFLSDEILARQGGIRGIGGGIGRFGR